MAAKILLVEDDNNLREIYEARLLAEGYTIVTARDGEEALVVAKAEKPDLVISDVMMPRISGFEMLDILRNTAELKYTKVIMLTALGQADDQTRANSLGADRYLVKSQVTLEDIVKAAHELIEGAPATPAPAAAAPAAPQAAPTSAAVPVVTAPPVAVAPAPMPAPTPVTPAPAAVPATPEVHVPEPAPVTPPTVPAAAAPAAPQAAPTSAAVPVVTAPPVAVAPAPMPAPTPVTPAPAAVPATPEVHVPEPAPVTPPTVPAAAAPAAAAPPQPRVPSPAPEPAALTPNADNVAESTAEEEATVHTQIENFINTNLTHPEANAGKPATASTPPVATADDSLLAQAVDALNASNDTGAAAPAAVPPETKPTDSAPMNEAAPVAPVIPKPENHQTAPAISNNAVTIANKKVIQPLKAEPKPGLNELLAREEAKEIINPTPVVMSSEPSTPAEQSTDTNATPPAVGPPGGDVFTPSAQTGTPTPEQSQSGIDPNSIAL